MASQQYPSMLHSFHRFSRLEVAQPVEAVAQVELGSCGVVDHGGFKAVRFADCG